MKLLQSILSTILFLVMLSGASAQDSTLVLSTDMMNDLNQIRISQMEGWIFKEGHDANWAKPSINTSDWRRMKPTELTSDLADENGRLEGWFRLRVRLDSSFSFHFPGIGYVAWAASEIYIDGDLIHTFGNTGAGKAFREFKNSFDQTVPLPTKMRPGEVHVIAIHFVDYVNIFSGKLKSHETGLNRFTIITGPGNWKSSVERSEFFNRIISNLSVTLGLLVFLLWILTIIIKEKYLLFVSIGTSFLLFFILGQTILGMGVLSFYPSYMLSLLLGPFVAGFILSLPIINAEVFEKRIPKGIRFIVLVLAGLMLLNIFFPIPTFPLPVIIISLSICLYYPIRFRKSLAGATWAIVSGLILFLLILVIAGLLFQFRILIGGTQIALLTLMATFLIIPLSLLVYVPLRFREMVIEDQKNSRELLRLGEEKKKILEDQNVKLEKQVSARTSELNKSLENLKSTQSQLIQSEKMASLGELTAGIAHEIQNPLNFVNNFSELNKDLASELKEALAKSDLEEANGIVDDMVDNEDKINHHGQRASSIVKGMLEHSRSGDGTKELTDINALVDEYLRLAYHGFRAKDPAFQSDFTTELSEDLPKINVVTQDIGRVILNLINNAFHAVNEQSKKETNHKPSVSVKTAQSPPYEGGIKGGVVIEVSDNGPGIPEDIKEKIFQPFFTTKATGEGTGLGLSLSYDIVTKGHGGELKVESKEGKGTEFIIVLPLV